MKTIVYLRSIALAILGVFLFTGNAIAQCAMCRAAVETNISEGSNLGSGLNAGILYLAAFPYIIFFGIAFLWFRNSQLNRVKNKQITGNSWS